jgi:hypothetical protein
MSSMPGFRHWDEIVRRWAVGLALVALFLQGATPAGFMLARQDGRATVTICTGHGAAVSVADLAGHPGKSSQSKPDAPCAFAGHGAAVSPPLAALIASPLGQSSAPLVAARFDLTPGRGLAAPPPPSQGPPQLTL